MNLPIKHDDIKVPILFISSIIIPFVIIIGSLILAHFFAPTIFLAAFLSIPWMVTSFGFVPMYVTIKSNRPKSLLKSEQEVSELEREVLGDYDGFIERLDAELEPEKEIVIIVPEPIQLIPASQRLNPNQAVALAIKNKIICSFCGQHGHSKGQCTTWDEYMRTNYY